jgi:hypothetical protein
MLEEATVKSRVDDAPAVTDAGVSEPVTPCAAPLNDNATDCATTTVTAVVSVDEPSRTGSSTWRRARSARLMPGAGGGVRSAGGRTGLLPSLAQTGKPVFGITESTERDARRLADLAIVLALEATVASGDPRGYWLVPSHEALLAIAAASGGSLSVVCAAAELLDPKVDATARSLLIHAEIYAAFWGD